MAVRPSNNRLWLEVFGAYKGILPGELSPLFFCAVGGHRNRLDDKFMAISTAGILECRHNSQGSTVVVPIPIAKQAARLSEKIRDIEVGKNAFICFCHLTDLIAENE